MDLKDYLIDQAGKDWSRLLAGCDALPPSFTLWLVNRFGDLFIALEDGSIHMLDVGVGTLKRLAESRDHFCDLLDEDDNANNWLMIPLVDQCVASGMHLAPDQCYNLKMPPLLGGKYSLDNIAPIDLAELYAFRADIFRQIEDVPDATAFRLAFVKKGDSPKAIALHEPTEIREEN